MKHIKPLALTSSLLLVLGCNSSSTEQPKLEGFNDFVATQKSEIKNNDDGSNSSSLPTSTTADATSKNASDNNITKSTEQPEPEKTPSNKPHLSAFTEKGFNDFVATQKSKIKNNGSNGSSSPTATPTSPIADADTTPESASDNNITNNQHNNVDEGGIVKKVGDILVVLRRGRLFTVNTGNNELTKADSVNAYAEGISPSSTWYDELLIKDKTVIVIGYSYGRGGTEIGLFSLDDDGKLTHKNTYNMRSNDYYSAENYASRLVDGKLVFYTPLYLNYNQNITDSLPAIRRWDAGKTKASDAFTPIIQTSDIYNLTSQVTDEKTERIYNTLHTVTGCNINDFELDCKSKGVLGGSGRVFYVSPTSVYTWIGKYIDNDDEANGFIMRMPLDGAKPTALKVKGAPFDQLSFLEKNDTLNVLLQEQGYGEGMWSKHFGSGTMSLLSVSLSDFGSETAEATLEKYHPTPRPKNSAYLNNRFVGDYLVYGKGNGWRTVEATDERKLYTMNLTNFLVNHVTLNHAADRIERLGKNVLAVGASGKGLGMTSVQLTSTETDAKTPEIKSNFVLEGANQSESRTHGFFYKNNTDTTGWLGLPIKYQVNTGASEQLLNSAASVMFLENNALSLSQLGKLDSRQNVSKSDNCKASCVDWYGNSRPIFIGNRVFALMGYELVEGAISTTADATTPPLTEIKRLNMLTGATDE